MSKRDLVFYLVVVAFVLAGVLFASHSSRKYQREIRDLQIRLAHAEESPDTFFIHDSIPVYKDRVVEVDKTDYKKLLADRELIKSLQLRISQVEAENRMLMSTRDTVVLEPTGDSILTYRDKWLSFSFEPKSRVLGCEVRDSLTTLITREYKHRFLWWRWGTKGYNVYHVNYNPHSRIEYNKFIRVKK